IGAGRMFAPGAPHKWRKENWRRSPVTQDRERHARAQGLVLENPRLALAGPTVGWIAAALDAVEGFAQPRALAHVRAPIAIIAAGRESIVDNDRTEAIARLLPDATFTRIEGAKHEIMMERDEYRAQFWAAFDALAARVAPAA
ncbi:MAG: alpha/beta hydrolase, partial [Hyphomonadaceae bacterium]